MDNGDLFGIEDWRTATAQCVIAVGGRKCAGQILWPSMTIEDSALKLDRCLNPQKRDVLRVEEFMLLVREARRAGCLIGVAFVNDFCECAPPVPTSPENELDELQRDFIRAQEAMSTIVGRMETLQRRGVVRSAA